MKTVTLELGGKNPIVVFPDADLATEEIFGPVLAAIPFDGYDEAVAIANSVEYGLTASVFTRDRRMERLATSPGPAADDVLA